MSALENLRKAAVHLTLAGSTLGGLIEAGCTPTNIVPSPDKNAQATREIDQLVDSTSIFPKGRHLTQDFFTQTSYQRIMAAANSFPEVLVMMLPGQESKIDLSLTPSALALADVMHRSRIEKVTFSSQGGFNVQFDFNQQGVALGSDYQKESPATAMMVVGYNEPTGKSLVAGADFTAWGLATNQRDPRSGADINHIGFMSFPFTAVPLERALGTDMVFILNRGLLGNQTDSAVMLPIKFKVRYTP